MLMNDLEAKFFIVVLIRCTELLLRMKQTVSQFMTPKKKAVLPLL